MATAGYECVPRHTEPMWISPWIFQPHSRWCCCIRRAAIAVVPLGMGHVGRFEEREKEDEKGGDVVKQVPVRFMHPTRVE
ncbi:hypothetical protein ColTof3_12359 [Colletotrichum tofieldiae]|nr:hypothetical protein ColTof3_12359 [Colletotrichum tofieldiae]GKT92206.1 hypothetical protein Ct61P_10056 [Colletotrichum tofieldiae]